MDKESSEEQMGQIWEKGKGPTVNAQKNYGGLLTWWDNSKYELNIFQKNANWLFLELEDLERNEINKMCNIYGPAQ